MRIIKHARVQMKISENSQVQTAYVDQGLTNESAHPRHYESPTMKSERLALITRGGSLGKGDSGDADNFQPAGM